MALLASACALLPLRLSAQTFKNPKVILTATDPMRISKGDLNGDSKVDLVYLDGGGGPFDLHILLGNGDGTFQRGQSVQLPLGIGGAITIADVNQDGRPDLMLGGGGPQGHIAVLLGNGDGTFQAPIVSQFTSNGPNYAAIGSILGVADFNGDGAVDLAAADTLNDVVYILQGDNSGSFVLKGTLFNGSGPANVLTSDLNGDGHIDLIVRGIYGADATVYLGNGDGTFLAGVRYTGPHNITSIILRDMDGDGTSDLVVTGFYNTLDILHGNGDGTFAATSSGGTSYAGPLPLLLAIADFNSDGILDFAVATGNGISFLLGAGNLAYGPPIPYSGSPSPGTAVMADFNGDGYEDFAEVAPGGIALSFGAADGKLQGADVYDLGQGAGGLAVADFNGDNVLDIAVNTMQPVPVVLLGQGGGKFKVPAMPDPPTSPNVGINFYTGDFNGDGKADLLLTNGIPNPSVTAFFGNGDGTFSAPVIPSITGSPAYGVALLGDFNRDGTTDVGVLDYQSLDILLGETSNTFKVETNSYPGLSESRGAAVGDFNNDGRPDIILTQSSPNPLQIMLGNGDGTFSLGRQLQAATLPQVLAVADLDGDGNADIVALDGFFDLAQIYYGNGNGSFQNPVGIPLQRGYLQMHIADMDNDGTPDLVLADNGVISIVPNLGNRNFGPEEHILAGSIWNFVVKDVNGDGLPDILVANGGTGTGITPTTVTVLLNQGAGRTIVGNLSVSPEPSTYGQPFAINLSITPEGTNPPAPTGDIVISIDNVPVAAVPAALNVSYNYTNSPSLSIGVHTLKAAYSGDANYIASTFSDQLEIVPILYPTTTTLTAAPATAIASQTVRFTATVTSPGQNANAPNPLSGTVVFRDGPTNLGTALVGSGGVAIFDTALLTKGTHNITAFYLGYEAQFQQIASFAPSNSAPVPITITASATSTTLTGTPSSVSVGGIVSMTAVVSSAAGTPTGAVTFLDGTSPLSVTPLDATGTAVFSASFGSSGTHALTAAYHANSIFAASTSAPVNISVTTAASPASSSTQLIVASDPQVAGQIVLTANVRSHSAAPSGTVSFLDGGMILGVKTLATDGVATYRLVLAGNGLHYLTAAYGGDSEFRPSVSATVLERVPTKDADFALDASEAFVSVKQGQSNSFLVTATSINGFSSALSLSCAAGSSLLSCNVKRPILQGGHGSSSVIVQTSRSPGSASSTVSFNSNFGEKMLSVMIFLLGAAVMLLGRRQIALCVFALSLVIWSVGCSLPSSSWNSPTPVGTYNVTIHATTIGANRGSTIVHSVPIQITVVAGEEH